MVVALWALATLLHILDQLFFPVFTTTPLISSYLYLSAVPVLAALVASAIAGLRKGIMGLASALLLVDCIAVVLRLGGAAAFGQESPEFEWVVWPLILLAAVIASAILTVRAANRQGSRRSVRLLAELAVILIVGAAPFAPRLDSRLYLLSSRFSPDSAEEPDLPLIDAERLWTAQPALVAHALAGIDSSPASTPRTFLVTVGAGGGQHLFGREARVARDVLGREFHAEQRSITLANDEESLYRAPLANNTNLEAVLSDVGRKIDDSKDLVVLYLTSHGSREAELTTNLPDYSDLQAIGAKRLADMLQRAGIRRRVVIVSACYSGTWIKPLASADTIVVTAARADRTSFGCSDDRELTYFGEALLKAPLPAGASLANRFALTRRTVARWEGVQRHSEPQAFVGRNMADVWKARSVPQ